jgi:hypothetical protein
MSGSLSADQIAQLLSDPATMTALTQLLAARQAATASGRTHVLFPWSWLIFDVYSL